MQKNNHRINELLNQYINKTISEKDFEELFSYINLEENKHVLLDFMQKTDKTDQPDAEVHQVNWDFMYQNIVTTQQKKTTISLKLIQKITIAASIMLVAFIGYKQYFKPNLISKSAEKVVVIKDLLPGGDNAILKIADGTELILNHQKNGIISEQGNTSIRKNEEGFIEYTAINQSSTEKPNNNTLSTPRGGQYKLMLPDKSLVWLNSESSITFPTAFVGNERNVKITGEVYFEIAKDKIRPFKVENGPTKIEVLGTHFNINTYTNEEKSKVTLLEGSIKLSNQNYSKILKPGQQAIFKNNETIQLSNIDVENAVDWKNGLFIFEDASLVSVMKDIERWYNIDVKYIGTVPEIKFNGIIQRNSNVSKLLKILKAAGNVDFEIKENEIIVKQKTTHKI